MSSNKQAKARMQLINQAIETERVAFNKAISEGCEVILTTFNGSYTVEYVDREFWYHTKSKAGYTQSWCGCNDGDWHNLLKQAGIKRALPEWERP